MISDEKLKLLFSLILKKNKTKIHKNINNLLKEKKDKDNSNNNGKLK